MAAPQSLITSWRERAAYLEQFGEGSAARLWKLAAVELERALKDIADETVSLAEAAELSGYTTDHIGNLVRRGVITNAGRSGAPRIHRKDIPTKRAGGPGRPDRQRLHITRTTRR